MRARLAGAALALLLPALLGGSCGGGGGRSVRRVEAIDARCATLTSFFPPGFDFVPGTPGRVWVVDFTPPTFLPFAIDAGTPQIAGAPAPFLLPFDSDGDGTAEGSAQLPLSPVIDDLELVAGDLGFGTASGYEEVLFFDPAAGGLRAFEVAVPAGLPAGDHPFLPAPGTSALDGHTHGAAHVDHHHG